MVMDLLSELRKGCQMSTRNKSAFTLMELLVVIAIIAMLLSIMTPSLRKAREQGKRAVCMANLHAIGMALYVDVALASDVVGVWGGVTPNPPSG